MYHALYSLLPGAYHTVTMPRCGMDLGPWEDGPGLLAVPQQQGEIPGVGSHGHRGSLPFGHQLPGTLSMDENGEYEYCLIARRYPLVN